VFDGGRKSEAHVTNPFAGLSAGRVLSALSQ
jgi:hypothetical protein